MPSVVSRWQGDPFQKPFRARKIALETACGALAPASVAATSPHVVLRVSLQSLPPASALGGAVFHDSGVAGGCTVGAGQGLAAFEAPADGEGVDAADAAGEAAVVVELVRRSSAAPMAMPRTTMTDRPIAIALRCARRRAPTRSCCFAAHFSYRRLAYSRSRLLGDT